MFEYDPAKSAKNKFKHGGDFLEAQVLWAGKTVEIEARTRGEKRTAVLGMIGTRYWTAIVTQRGKNIRIISVRRSHTNEVISMKKPKKKIAGRITTRQFDKLFDEGGDILPYLDLKSARVVEPIIQRFNVDLPEWALSALDNAAARRGIARQALVKSWLVECLEREGEKLVKAA